MSALKEEEYFSFINFIINMRCLITCKTIFNKKIKLIYCIIYQSNKINMLIIIEKKY
jgi:hypothetical protein